MNTQLLKNIKNGLVKAVSSIRESKTENFDSKKEKKVFEEVEMMSAEEFFRD